MNSKLEVKKVLDIVVSYSICCDLCNEITYNYLEKCPTCNQSNVKLEEYGSLQTYFTGKREFCTCSICNTKFKLVSDEWYYPNFPKSSENETKVVLIPFDKNSQ